MRKVLRWVVVAASAALVAWVVTTADLGGRSPLFRTLGAPAEAEAGERVRSDLSRLRLLTRCIGYVRSNYVVPQRVKPKALLLGALRGAEGAVADLLVTPDTADPDALRTVKVRIGDHQRTFDVGEVGDLYEMNWKLLDVFEFVAGHLPGDVKPEDVEHAAINGLLQPLDEHSVFLVPEAYQEMKLDTEGKFGGLGIVISTRKGLITIVSVMPDTPAFKAALRTGDQILQIGDESAINMGLTDAVSRLRGEPGTDVTVLLQRKEWAEPRSITLTRAEIHVRSVTSEDLGDGIGYARIRNFQEDTADQLATHLGHLKARGGLKGLVLDLRQNPGGLLEQAVEVANLFVRKGPLVTTEGEGKRMRQEYEADGRAPFADLPLAVLVDGGSASAAEIVAGALKNDDRAPLIGATTFGKGTVQVMYEVGDGALKLTVAQYLTPGDVSIQGVGVAPDVELVPAAVDGDLLALGTGDDRRERDPKRLLEAFGKVSKDVPVRRIRHLVAGEGGGGGEEADEDDPPLRDEEAFRRDEAIDLAQKVARSLGNASRNQGLAAVGPSLDAWSREQDIRLVERLAERGVDWSDGPRRPGAPVRVSWAVEGPDPLVPGQKATLRVTARNAGPDPLYRVRVVTESDFGLLDGREFVFGRLGPGESVVREVPVKVPADTWDRQDRVGLRLFQGDDEQAAPPAVTVATRGLARPRFAWSLQVVDGGGNGDGVLQPGETATLLVDVQNVGEGAAKKLLATLRAKAGQEGLYVREGRANMPEGLAPGKAAQARFKVEMRKVPAGGAPVLEVGLLDMALREFVSEEIPVPVAAAAGPSFAPAAGALRTLREGVAVRGAAREDAPVLFPLPAGFFLRASARGAGWWRVEVEEGRFAFVKEEDAAPEAGTVRFSALPLSPQPSHVVPALDVRLEDLPPAEGSTRPRVRVVGQARFAGHEGEARRKVLVFRGSDKVHFWTRKGPTLDAVVEVDAVVELAEGRNDLAVFAIEGKDRSTVRRFARHLSAPAAAGPAASVPATGAGGRP